MANFTILSNTDLTDKVNELISTSNSEEVKSFFNSSLGTFFIELLVSTYETNNYAIITSINELFFDSVVEYSNAIRLANNLGYHVKRKIPAKIYYSIIFNDSTLFNNVSRIKFKGGEFFINYNGYTLYQRYDYDYFVNTRVGDGDNYLVEGNLSTSNFNITNFSSYNEVLIENENISNYIGNSSSLDLSVYSQYYDEDYLVIRDSVNEDDISSSEYICFCETTPNKYIKIIFGNDSIGKIPYGRIAATYFTTSGSDANNGISSGETFESLNNTGIEMYDLDGNMISNIDTYLSSMSLVFDSSLSNGYDFESIKEIGINSRKFFSLNNTLNNKSDFEYYLKNKYNLNDNKVWGSGSEINFRDSIDYSNLVLFTSSLLDYGDVLVDTDSSILFNIYSNISWIENTNTYNRLSDRSGSIFEVVTQCDDSINTVTKTGNPCISLGTLYLLGYFKPITLFYNNVMDKNYDTEVSRIINDLNNKSTIGLYGAFLNSFKINLDVTIYYKTLGAIKTYVEENSTIDFNKLTDKSLSALVKIVNEYGKTSVNYNDVYLEINNKRFNITSVEQTLLEYMNNNLSNPSIVNAVNIMSKKYAPNVIYDNSLETPMKMSNFIYESNMFLNEMFKIFGHDYNVTKVLLDYFVKKSIYNVYQIVESKDWDLLDLDFFNITISNIAMRAK